MASRFTRVACPLSRRASDVARHRHLSNAPVREALIDLQFESPVALDVVDGFASSMASDYEKKGDIWEAFFGFSVEGGADTKSAHASIGRRLEARGRPYVLQCRKSGFTVSRLSPYGQWSELLAETQRCWSAFTSLTGDPAISRIGVRYINEIKLPLPISAFSDFLVCPPKVPEALPQAISGFITRVLIPDPMHECTSIVTHVLEAPPTTGASDSSITILLDIDVFRVTGGLVRAGKLWEALGVLRDQKNRMFFEHLTERTVERYE